MVHQAVLHVIPFVLVLTQKHHLLTQNHHLATHGSRQAYLRNVSVMEATQQMATHKMATQQRWPHKMSIPFHLHFRPHQHFHLALTQRIWRTMRQALTRPITEPPYIGTAAASQRRTGLRLPANESGRPIPGQAMAAARNGNPKLFPSHGQRNGNRHQHGSHGHRKGNSHPQRHGDTHRKVPSQCEANGHGFRTPHTKKTTGRQVPTTVPTTNGHSTKTPGRCTTTPQQRYTTTTAATYDNEHTKTTGRHTAHGTEKLPVTRRNARCNSQSLSICDILITKGTDASPRV